MPNAAYRERQRLSVEQGLDAPHVPAAARAYDKFIGEMETALVASPYLAGQTYSLADAAATSCIFRTEMLGLDKLWVGKRCTTNMCGFDLRQGQGDFGPPR